MKRHHNSDFSYHFNNLNNQSEETACTVQTVFMKFGWPYAQFHALWMFKPAWKCSVCPQFIHLPRSHAGAQKCRNRVKSKHGEQVEPFNEINSVSRTNVSITWPCETVYCVLVSSLLKDKCNRASVLKKVHIKYGKEEIKMPRSCTWSTRRWNTNSWNMCGSILQAARCVSVDERQKGNTHRCAPGINQSRGRYQTHKVSLWPAEVQLDLRLNL